MLRRNVMSSLSVFPLLILAILLESSAGDSGSKTVKDNQDIVDDEILLSNEHQMVVDAYPYFNDSSLVSAMLVKITAYFGNKVLFRRWYDAVRK